MRFDNPIKNHKFKKLPDIASFLEVRNEYRNNNKIDLSSLEKALKKKDKKKFIQILNNIFKESYKEKKASKKEISEKIKFMKKLNQYFDFYKKFKVKSQKITKNKIFNDLYNEGFSFLKLDSKNLWSKYIASKYRILCKKKDWRPPPGTFDRWINLNEETKKKINKILIDKKVIQACEAYYSKKMSVSHVRLTVCRPTDNSWKQFLYDCQKTTKYTNLHMDPLEGVIKAMIYLNKVNKNNGPTSFLPKSNRFILDPIQSLFARTIAIGNYCHNKFSRRCIFRLPKKLRVTTNFGRLIDDNSTLSKYLDKNLKILTSDKGDTILFDPGSGIHNGGVVKNGERIALQVVIE